MRLTKIKAPGIQVRISPIMRKQVQKFFVAIVIWPLLYLLSLNSSYLQNTHTTLLHTGVTFSSNYLKDAATSNVSNRNSTASKYFVPASNHFQEVIGQPPNMILLQNLGIFSELDRTGAQDLGTILLHDTNGLRVKNILQENLRNEDINREIFRQWLNGVGYIKTTWKQLINVLRQIKELRLAENIEQRVRPEFLDMLSLPYDYSEPILDIAKSLKKKYVQQKTIVFDLLKTEHELPFLELITRSASDNSEVSLDQVLQDANDYKRLIITGQPGCGKTTLIRYLAKRWAEGEIFKSCQLLFVVYLDENNQEHYTLSDLLEKYKDLDIPFHEITRNNGEGVCLLMDGFDEKDHKRDYVHRLMINDELSLSTRILTSRPDEDLMNVQKNVEIIGFGLSNLNDHLDQLTPNTTTRSIVRGFWNNHQVKEMCQLPLLLTMIIFIAQTTDAELIKTKTQIYTAFMNTTIKHYKNDHPKLNTISLRECITDTSPSGKSMSCLAFNTMHKCAFEMTYERTRSFSLSAEVREQINKLGFVSIKSKNMGNDEVTIVFSHRSFMEYFTSIHLITLSHNDQMFHLLSSTGHSLLADFYFGLLGYFHPKNISALTLPLKQYSFTNAIHTNKWEHVCLGGFYKAFSSSSIKLHQEIGWTGQQYRDLLESAGIVSGSSTCIHLPTRQDSTAINYMLEHARIHRLSIILGKHTFISTMSFKEPVEYLNVSHLKVLNCSQTDFIQRKKCIAQRLTESTVTYYHLQKQNLVRFFFRRAHRKCSFGLTLKLDSYDQTTKTKLSHFSISTVHMKCCLEELPSILTGFPHITILSVDEMTKCMLETNLTQVTSLSQMLLHPAQLHTLVLKTPLQLNLSLFLRNLTTLRQCHIILSSNTKLDSRHVERISGNSIHVLNISHNILDHTALKALSLTMPALSMLQNLNLRNTNLNDSDVQTLSEGIISLQDLTHLDLANNNIVGKGVLIIARQLKQIHTFRSLNLYNNPITGQANIEALAQLTELHTLHISVQTSEDKVVLSKVVKSLTKLKSFQWSHYQYP